MVRNNFYMSIRVDCRCPDVMQKYGWMICRFTHDRRPDSSRNPSSTMRDGANGKDEMAVRIPVHKNIYPTNHSRQLHPILPGPQRRFQAQQSSPDN